MKTMCPPGLCLVPTGLMLLALLVEHPLVHWYQQCGTVHHVPKCMSCHKAIVVIIRTRKQEIILAPSADNQICNYDAAIYTYLQLHIYSALNDGSKFDKAFLEIYLTELELKSGT